MAFRFVTSNPALSPLFFAVGLGVVGSVGFAAHYLANSPDVVIKKSFSRDPWNNVSQGTNSKLISFQPEFWQSRVNMPDPRAAYLGADANASNLAKAKAARKLSKEDSIAH